ncbi:MAG: DUF4385 family protein [Thermomicrobiales bacterium]
MTNDTIDYRAHPEHYRIGRGEAGVFHIEPYSGELSRRPGPSARPRSLCESAEAIVAKYREYRDSGDFVGKAGPGAQISPPAPAATPTAKAGASTPPTAQNSRAAPATP